VEYVEIDYFILLNTYKSALPSIGISVKSTAGKLKSTSVYLGHILLFFVAVSQVPSDNSDMQYDFAVSDILKNERY